MREEERAELPVGYWWRASEYVLEGGYLRPAPGARFEPYDPWEAYRAARSHGKQEDAAPYQELLALADIRFVFVEGRFEADSEGRQRLLAWCKRYGLLGVLLNRVREVHLAPRWGRIGLATLPGQAMADPGLARWLYPTQERFFRTATGWRTRLIQYHEGQRPGPDGFPAPGVWCIVDEPEREGTLVEADRRPPGMTVGALVRKLDAFEWEWEPLAKTWARFFPDTPREERETREYPLPLSEEFWREYAEPLGEFMNAVRALETALRLLQESRRARLGLEKINALAEGVNLALVEGEEGFRQAWVSTSLLGTLAAMAIFDLSGRKRALRCETCGKPFVSGAPQARYCSDTCRHTAQKRAYRQRIYEARRLHAQGLPLEEIARRVGSGPATVRGWLKGGKPRG